MRKFLGLLALFAFAACGDNFSQADLAKITVAVDNNIVEPDEVVGFGKILQAITARNIIIHNDGTADLVVESIGWDTDEQGQPLKNKYVDIDWLDLDDSSVFPWTIDRDSRNPISFRVKYTAPPMAPDDLSDSVLVIKSNAFDGNGRREVPEFRIVFSVREEGAVPQVSPGEGVFQNATMTRSEDILFTVSNDRQRATAPFKILNVYLEQTSSEYTLLDTPRSGTEVGIPGSPDYREVQFSVRFLPLSENPSTNYLVVETDVSTQPLFRIPLSWKERFPCEIEVSYSHSNGFDFTGVSSQETRSAILTCLGPGSATIRQPVFAPTELGDDFEMKVFAPASNPEGEDREVTSWPRGLQVGRSLRFDLTYQPASGGADTRSGQLSIPYDHIAPGEIDIDIYSGKPKSKIELAPAPGNIVVTGPDHQGSRELIIYNRGNGPLSVTQAEVIAEHGVAPVVWALDAPFAPLTVPAGGIAALKLNYDIEEVKTQTGTKNEQLILSYINDFTGNEEELPVGLRVERVESLDNPVASLGSAGDYAGAVVGEGILLSGAASVANAGEISANAYIYMLLDKPAGSRAHLNVQSGPEQTFIPDVAGNYTFGLLVYAREGSQSLFSETATVTVQVAE